MSGTLCMVVVRAMGGGELLRVGLERGEYVLGSASASQLVVSALGVMPQHVFVRIGEFGVEVEAVSGGSRVRVEGNPVDGAVLLLPGQRVQIGSVFLDVGEGGGEPEAGCDPALANYELGEEVARGGMGAIHVALEKSTGRTVAMKVLRADRADLVQRGRFVAEARVTAGLEHPGVVPVYTLGTNREGSPFYSMKLIGGVTLKAVLEAMAGGDEGVLRRHPLPVLLGVFEKVCDAVAYAHSRSWIHRDLKPENIMIGEFGEVLVMDWGIAKRIGEGAGVDDGVERAVQGDALAAGGEGDAALSTLDGEVVGTPHFMSPEQARGENGCVDARSDIYALGAILYQMLSLRHAVEPGKVLEVLGRVGRGELRVLEAPLGVSGSHLPGGRIPSSLAAVVGKAMALLPQERYADVAGLREDLARFQGGFLTGAEARGTWRRWLLFLRRNGAASVAALAVLACGVVSGVRIVRDVGSASRAIEDVRSTAMALRATARQEAECSRLESALLKLDGADVLEPGSVESMEQRAWLCAGLGRMSEAATAMERWTQGRERAGDGELQQALKLLQRFRAAPVGEWSPVDRGLLLRMMERRGFSRERRGLSRFLQMHGAAVEVEVKAAFDRLGASKSFGVSLEERGLVEVVVHGGVLDLSPLRGLPISVLKLGKADGVDLSPLSGMQLSGLVIRDFKVVDCAFLRGMPLERLEAARCDFGDSSMLKGMPLRELSLQMCDGLGDLGFLSEAPLETAAFYHSRGLKDIRALKGKPLRQLFLCACPVSDISPLAGSSIEVLDISRRSTMRPREEMLDLMGMKNLREVKLPDCDNLPEELRKHPTLRSIWMDGLNSPRPARKFWQWYDRERVRKDSKP